MLLAVVVLMAGCGDHVDTADVVAGDDGKSAVTTIDPPRPVPTTPATRAGMLIVFLDDDASQEAIDAVRDRLEGHVGVGNVTYFTHEEAHAEFVAMFKDQPDMVSKTSPAELPRSLRVKPDGRDDELAIANAVSAMDGVKEVICDGRGRCQ